MKEHQRGALYRSTADLRMHKFSLRSIPSVSDRNLGSVSISVGVCMYHRIKNNRKSQLGLM